MARRPRVRCWVIRGQALVVQPGGPPTSAGDDPLGRRSRLSPSGPRVARYEGGRRGHRHGRIDAPGPADIDVGRPDVYRPRTSGPSGANVDEAVDRARSDAGASKAPMSTLLPANGGDDRTRRESADPAGRADDAQAVDEAETASPSDAGSPTLPRSNDAGESLRTSPWPSERPTNDGRACGRHRTWRSSTDRQRTGRGDQPEDARVDGDARAQARTSKAVVQDSDVQVRPRSEGRHPRRRHREQRPFRRDGCPRSCSPHHDRDVRRRSASARPMLEPGINSTTGCTTRS